MGEDVAPVRLLIVDNHTLFRQGLVSLLQGEPGYEVVGEASSGEEALQLVPKLGPDVVLMDVKMPGIGGVEATRRIIEANPGTRVLMLTVSEEEENLFAAIQAGARGYILKNADAGELLEAIQRVHAGEAQLSPIMTLRLLQALQNSGLPVSSVELPLTSREQDVFQLLAKGASNRQIAETLMITENTVKTHVRNILEKLGLHSRSEVAAYARRISSIL
ncbi:MAG: response regulator transcription factor [Anaerolineae bacterium]